MICRDANGFIGQAEVDQNLKQYEPIRLDFGDCACREGLLAMTGSKSDAELLPKLVKDGLLIRYPGQEERGYNRTEETSRDQLIGWAAGIPYIDRPLHRFQAQDTCTYYASQGHINKDILMPDVQLFLYTVAGFPAPLHVRMLGLAQLPFSILWACYVKPDHELNQLISLLSVFDKKWMRMLVHHHPDYRKNLEDYWKNSWRNMGELSELLIQFVEDKIK